MVLLIQNTKAILKRASKNKLHILLAFSLLSSPILFAQTTLTTRATGNWNANDTWISGTLTGTITTATNSSTVIGVGTNFTTQLSVGAALYRTDGTTLIGTISSITNDTSMTLTGNAANANSGISFRTRKVPGDLDTAVVLKDKIVITIPIGISATCSKLEIGSSRTNSEESLTFSNATSSLSVSGNVKVYGLTGGGIREITLNACSMGIGGNLELGTGQLGTQNNRITKLTITTGTITVSGNLSFNNVSGSDPAQTQIIMSGGAGTFNLGGDFIISNTSGTLLPGTSSSFKFNGSAAQTIPIGVSNVVYNNMNINNLSAATLSATVSATNVTGNIKILTGTLNNGGFAMAGSSVDTFSISNDAILNLSGTSTFPTGFGTTTLGTTSTVNYSGTNQNVASKSYGNLALSASGNKTFEGATTIAGNLTLSGNIGGIQWQTSSDDITFTTIAGATSTTYTPTNINATTYFRTVATNGVCKNANSPSVSVAVRTTTFDGSAWSNGNPAANATIAFNLSGNYTLNSDISACSCTIISGNITVPSGKSMNLIDKLTVSGGSITFENNANLIQTNSGVNSGVITVKRNLAPQVRLDHTLWSSPVENVNLFGFYR